MKKLICALVLGASIYAKSQVIITGMTLTIINYSPDQVCECDSIKVTIKWRYDSPIINPNAVIYTLSYWVYIPSTMTFSYIPTRYFTASDMWAMNKTPNPGGDTMYHFSHQIQCDFVETYADGTNDNVNTDLTFGAGAHMYLRVFNCVSGIEQYSINGKPIQYYDFNLMPIDPRRNQLMFKKVGNKYTKVLIVD